MPTNRKVIDFKIHNLTEEQFQELKEAGQIDPNAIYCTPDETVANFEAVNARIDEAIQTEQQHNIEINARVDETVANFEEINTEIEALKDKGGIPLLTPMWADHTLNDISWLNADTFSWQSGDVYVAAYEHLASEAVFETGTRKYIYIKSDVSHDRFDNGLRYYRTPENDEVEPIHTCAWKATDGVIVFTKEEAPEGDTAYTDGGAAASSRIGYVTETGEETFYSNAETETIDGITITFCRAEDGHKICPAGQEANVQALYEKTGVAWYYILDIKNKQFKLPRTKWGFTGLRDNVGGYIPAGLPNITAWFNAYSYGDGGGSGAVTSKISTSNTLAGGSQSSYNFNNFSIDASRSSSTYGASNTVQPKATQMYLYFYVGNFEKEAVEQTAGINAEMFNSKADRELNNVPSNYDYVVASQEPTSANGYTWFRKYKSGWVEQGGRQYGELTAVYGEATSFGIITLPVPMSNGNSYYAGATGNGYTCLMNVHPSATTIKFDFGAYTTNRTLTQVRWFVAGYAA